jgi:hypothetical protein
MKVRFKLNIEDGLCDVTSDLPRDDYVIAMFIIGDLIFTNHYPRISFFSPTSWHIGFLIGFVRGMIGLILGASSLKMI